MTLQATGPITQRRAEDATEWLVHNAENIATAKARKDRAEHMLRVVKSIAMKGSDEKSAAAQEREAYASDQYMEAINEVYEATLEHEKILALKYAAQEVTSMWRSINANLRGSGV